MQQAFRRQLLGLGRLGGTQAQVDGQCRQFISAVLAVKIELRPNTIAVLDVLSNNRVATAIAARFVDMFDATVWSGAR